MSKTKKLIEEQEIVIANSIVADQVLDTVLEKVEVKDWDPKFYSHLKSVLKARARDRILVSIWAHIDDQQMSHFSDYLGQMTIVMPEISAENCLIAFANLYPTLMDKVFKDLAEFFVEFAENFSEIDRA